MNDELLSDILNKLTAPKIALEKLAQGENLPSEFIELALKELELSLVLIQKMNSSS